MWEDGAPPPNSTTTQHSTTTQQCRHVSKDSLTRTCQVPVREWRLAELHTHLFDLLISDGSVLSAVECTLVDMSQFFRFCREYPVTSVFNFVQPSTSAFANNVTL